MGKLNPTQRAQLIQHYKKGKASPELARIFGITATRVCQIVREEHIARPARKGRTTWKLTEEQRQTIKNLYLQGKTGHEIARRFELGTAAPYRVLKKFGIESRGPSEARRKLRLDIHAFDKITEASAYWLGFLMADGSVKRKNTTWQVCLALAEKDERHVYRFREFLQSGHRIRRFHHCNPKSTPSVGISITSKPLGESLIHWGVIPNKTFIAEAHPMLESNRDFWRGIIDGDGCLQIDSSGRIHLSLIGAKSLLHQFLSFAKNNLPSCSVNVRPKENIYIVSFIANRAKQLIHLLYENASIVLERKRQIVETIMAMPFKRWRHSR